MTPALYLIDTSGVFRILQDKLRQAWSDQLTAGVIATCPVVDLEFLYSATSLADRLSTGPSLSVIARPIRNREAPGTEPHLAWSR